LADKYKEIIASFGGRAITNAIENEIMKPLSKNLLKAEYESAHDVVFKVKAENGRIIAYS
jgi:ATP-dependent Clp protease ATP-binding subunit ClpA